METDAWKMVEGMARQRKKKNVAANKTIYLFIYLFVVNACNLKVMARFRELNSSQGPEHYTRPLLGSVPEQFLGCGV
jgi:hypothetical protein